MSLRIVVYLMCKNIIYVYLKIMCCIKVGKNCYWYFIFDYLMRCFYDLVLGLI